MPVSNPLRQAFLLALYNRVGEHDADQKTTVMDFVGGDLGLSRADTDAVVEVLMKAGLVTAPTRERVIGLTPLGIAVARRRAVEAASAGAGDRDEDGDEADD
jgi:hypothetical protein